MEVWLGLLVGLAEIYFAAGLVFAVAFVLKGAGRIDPAAREGTWGFRLVILPGCVALWPFLAWRWWTGQGHPPEEASAHIQAAKRSGSPEGEP